MTQDPEGSGLDLFDENASAVRGFPNAMLGYDKKAVDDYIRDIERQLSIAKHQLREVQRELTAANLRVDDTDFSRLGTHTAQLLKAAEAQAGDLVQRAELRAERLLGDARAEAERVQREASQHAQAARQEGIDSLRSLRSDLERQTTVELDAARSEAAGLREAADTHRATVIEDAQRRAESLLAEARADADAVRQSAEREAADLRAALAQEREEALTALAAEHRAQNEALAQAADAATSHSQELLAALADAADQLRGRQQAALAEAENTKLAALDEARAILNQAQVDAEARLADTDSELVARNDQLKRELRTLRQRKQALLTQLTQLSSLATETTSEFPEDEHTGPVLAALAGLTDPSAGDETPDERPASFDEAVSGHEEQ
ncbi:DivIVA domain-containing protein [Propioniciclava soli]|uniref:DivIVA domain-containing protein n=1 Tax=Propioniciclava soli TaxID=2775081 RepID=A0ABZ3C4G4_9ACTN|nr:DivIVA domain-containing protein [Propioniciclava soli]